MTTRRAFLGGCAALVALLAADTAHARRRPRRAPRLTCPHGGCRHHRVGSETPGLCGLALAGGPIAYPDEVLP